MYSYELQNEKQCQMQAELQLQYQKNRQELEFIATKESIITNNRTELSRRKLAMQEERTEMRKARYEEVVLCSNGEMELCVKNSMINTPKRRIANCAFVDIKRVTGMESREKVIYVVTICIDGNDSFVTILKDKSANEQYLLNKFTEAGVRFYANKKSDKLNHVGIMWNYLLLQCEEESRIPEHFGWIKDYEGKLHFIKEGEILWESIEKMAK